MLINELIVALCPKLHSAPQCTRVHFSITTISLDLIARRGAVNYYFASYPRRWGVRESFFCVCQYTSMYEECRDELDWKKTSATSWPDVECVKDMTCLLTPRDWLVSVKYSHFCAQLCTISVTNKNSNLFKWQRNRQENKLDQAML